MRYKLLLLFLVKSFQASAQLQAPLLSPSIQYDENAPSISHAVINAPHIFNTINGAMRQWGNSLKHNGMSIYPVTVAANTLLYHGSVSDTPVNNVTWFAFEAEHSEAFFKLNPADSNNGMIRYSGHVAEQNYTGYFSTYRTTRSLKKVIYLDGISAGKSTMGTLDIQDRVLLQDTGFKSRKGDQDSLRAQEICKLLPHLDGIVRMEPGFELILCDASKNLELLSITSHPQHFYLNKTENVFWRTEYMRGVSKRYSGLGIGKVLVDFSSMISAYFYPLNLTNPNPKTAALPRINPEEREKIKRFRDDVVAVFGSQSKPQESIEWQGIVDEIVSRYSDRLAYMESKKSSRYEMISETNFLIERFINHTALNMTASKEQCTSVYLLRAIVAPTMTWSDKLIYEAVATVSRKICNLLFEMRETLIARQDAAVVEEAKSMVRDLMKWLDWSRWKECGRCDWDEVCFVAVWPWGTQEDHDHPRCRKINQWWTSVGYWDYDFGDDDEDHRRGNFNPLIK